MGRNQIYLRAFHIYCPICVEFSIGDLKIILLNIYEFRESRIGKGIHFSAKCK